MSRRVACAAGLWAALVGCDVAPLTPKVPPPAPASLRCNVEVYCLLGLWNIWSLGLIDLSNRLMESGVPSIPVSGTDWRILAQAIGDDRAASGNGRPIVLVGHSFGGDDAIRIAQALEARGLRVNLILLVDATNPAPVPANVDKCVAYYLPTSLANMFPAYFPGNPAELEDGNKHTELINVRVTQEIITESLNFGHLDLDSSESLHALIELEVFALCPQN